MLHRRPARAHRMADDTSAHDRAVPVAGAATGCCASASSGDNDGVPERLHATWAQVHSLRARRHFLSGPRAGGAVEVACRLSGVHAQTGSSAELAIGIRAEATRPEDVRRALSVERSLVKTWTLRWGTLHLVPAADLPLWVGALRARGSLVSAAVLRYLGISRAEWEACLDAIPRALAGRALTREELAREVAQRIRQPAIEPALRDSWGGVLKHAAWQGLLCFGPEQGRNVTFVEPRGWLSGQLGAWPEIDGEEAQVEILSRFLDAYGPATREHFKSWFGPGLEKGGRALFTRLADELVEVDVEGRPAVTTPAGVEELMRQPVEETVRLLPTFDPYTVGFLGDLDPLMPGPFRARISRTAGHISAAVVVGGRLLGTWRHEVAGGRMRIAVAPFAPLAPRVRAGVEADAERVAALLGARAEVVVDAG
jgi:hypothetical protein